MSPDPLLGAVIGGCRIKQEIGQGGMGVVYLAEQIRLRREVALKVLSPDLAHDETFRARFDQEAQLAASLDHPNVVSIYDSGESHGMLFLVMQYVKGTDLQALIREAGVLGPQRAASLVTQVAAALDAAHERGLVHRDVKPANILLRADEARAGDDRAYLSDFGLMKLVDTKTGGLTATGYWMGTPDYTPPEQFQGRRVDARTDVYALGCVLFQLLAGTVPYPRSTTYAALSAHVNDPIPSATALDDSIPKAFDTIFQRALAKDPSERYASAGDLARAALAATAGRPLPREDHSVAVGNASPSPTLLATTAAIEGRQRAERGGPDAHDTRRRLRLAGLATLVLLALAATAIGVLGGGRHAPARAGSSTAPRSVRATVAPSLSAGTTTSVASAVAHTASAPAALRYVAYGTERFSVQRPAGWTTVMQQQLQGGGGRLRSEWSSASCGCDLVLDYIKGYHKTALQNASEVPGGTVQVTKVGAFTDVALRTADEGSGRTATYFIAHAGDNYAVRASAPSMTQAMAIASRVAASLSPSSG